MDMKTIETILSLLPPIISIILALKTKEVVSSLIVGILSGTLIYTVLNIGGNFIQIGAKTVEVTMSLMAEKLSENGSIIIFLALLGALVVVVTKAGGSKAYGEWASQKIKSKQGAKLSTFFLGIIIFIDDYFNCLTVGTVMSPVTDKYKISREKLAYIIDATAAPICIIAPVSSWAASVISQMSDSGLNGIQDFIKTIPYNLYALLTIIMVLIICLTNFDFGKMAQYEKLDNDGKSSENITEQEDDELSKITISDKGTVFDLVIPVVLLIISSIVSMLYIGGYFEGGITLAEGFGNTDAGPALAISGFFTLVITFLLFVPRKVLSFKEFMSGISSGVKSMVPAYIILTLAWTISGVCRDLLDTGGLIGSIVANSHLAGMLIPIVAFCVASLLAFSMGTSWGTFGILIPIIAVVCENTAPELTIISLSAVLAGSVFGDHCSPISDTTILSSTGARCKHINHVSTQIPYTLVVAISCAVGYIVAGITKNLLLTWVFALTTMLIILFVLYSKNKKEINKI